MTRRTDRVEDLLRSELSDLFLRRVGDPRVRLTTVSHVTVTPDLRRAVVRLSVLGDEDERESCLEAAQRASGFLKAQLARRLRHMRMVPDLVFELDRGAEHSARISQLLDSLGDHDESA